MIDDIKKIKNDYIILIPTGEIVLVIMKKETWISTEVPV